MPLGGWLKSWTTEQPPERSQSEMVADSLIMELEFQIRELEDIKRKEEEEARRAKGGVDYSWLSHTPINTFEMPQLERMDLEQLCSKVKPDECGRVITLFRDAISIDPVVENMPRMLRASVLQVIEGRPKEETIPEWLTKSLTSLSSIGKIRGRSASRSRKITPLCPPEIVDDLEMQRPESSISTVSLSVSSSGSLPNFYVKSENIYV